MTTVHNVCTVGSYHERFVENKSGNCFIANWLIHRKKTEHRKAGIACQLGQPWLIAHLGDLCIFYLLFVLLIGILPTERRVQQCIHQVNPTLVGSSYQGLVKSQQNLDPLHTWWGVGRLGTPLSNDRVGLDCPSMVWRCFSIMLILENGRLWWISFWELELQADMKIRFL